MLHFFQHCSLPLHFVAWCISSPFCENKKKSHLRKPSYQANISSGNQPLCANYGNFNINHTILIQGRTHERWEGWFAKFMGGGRDDLQRYFCKSLLPPPLSAPLDQSCGSDWSFHSFHGEVGSYLICCRRGNKEKNKVISKCCRHIVSNM
jgi:hypothetical protein